MIIGALVLRELEAGRGGTILGHGWEVLQPVAVIAVLALGFGHVVQAPPHGESFVLFYATGYLPFHAWAETASQAGHAVLRNRPLLQLPMIRPLDLVVARFLLSALTTFASAGLILGTLLALAGEGAQFDLPGVVLALAAALILGLGTGIANAVLTAVLPAWARIWPIIARAGMIGSAVFYSWSALPADLRRWLWWNPLVHVIEILRTAIYPDAEAEGLSLTVAVGAGLALAALAGAAALRLEDRLAGHR